MAKMIKYKVLSCEVNGEQTFFDVGISWNESNEEIAKREAYNGEYEIYDDGQPEPENEATTDDVLNALLGVTE